jgi:hypothetical protein
MLALWLGFRVANLEQRLHDVEEGIGKDLSENRHSPPRSSAQARSVAEVESVRGELELLHAELEKTRNRISALGPLIETNRRTTPGHPDTPHADGILLADPAGWSTGFIPASNTPVEHWTGGEKRRWGHEQAAGEPDTAQAGDVPSAWASKLPDGGEEWLQVDYERPVDLQQINVIESHNPGAISKVVAVLPDGRETTVWEGTLEPSGTDEQVSSEFPVTHDIRAQSVKVYLDTARVPGWNEIDAVQVVGRDGTKQWANASRASSSYADP